MSNKNRIQKRQKLTKEKTFVRIFDTTNGVNDLIYKTHNATLLPGRVSALERVFCPKVNINQHMTFKKIMSNPNFPHVVSDAVDDILTDGVLLNSRKVGYFCIGNGGINLNPLVLSEAKPHETRLYNMVPFHCIKEEAGWKDLDADQKEIYKLRVRIKYGEHYYVCYYLKKFVLKNNNEISLVKANGSIYVPEYTDSEPADLSSDGSDVSAIENTSTHSFVDFDLDILPEDFKEYYKLVSGSGGLNNAYLSEFGICMANEKPTTINSGGVTETYSDVYNVELFSKVVHAPAYMNKPNNSVKISYQIYT